MICDEAHRVVPEHDDARADHEPPHHAHCEHVRVHDRKRRDEQHA